VGPVGHILTPYPSQVGTCSQKGAAVAKVIDHLCMQILKTHRIQYLSISFRSIWRKCYSSEVADTLLIETHDTDTSAWQTAATEILQLFLDNGLKAGEIKVEICSPIRTVRDHSRCLPDDERLLGAMQEVEPRVEEVVKRELSSTWTSIAFHIRVAKSAICGPRSD
jgi:hypothetical protein